MCSVIVHLCSGLNTYNVRTIDGQKQYYNSSTRKMLTNDNRERLLDKLKGHYKEVGELVFPKPVTGDFVRRVLKGERKSDGVDIAAVEFGEKLDAEASQLNARVKKIRSL